MSRAFKCNHCGKFYDPKDYPEKKFITFDNMYSILGKNYDIGDPLGHKFDSYFTNLDFCEDCSKKILEFMTPIKKEEKKKEPKHEKENQSFSGDIQLNLHDTLKQFVDSVEGGGLRILREYLKSVCDGETSERESGTKQKSDD